MTATAPKLTVHTLRGRWDFPAGEYVWVVVDEDHATVEVGGLELRGRHQGVSHATVVPGLSATGLGLCRAIISLGTGGFALADRIEEMDSLSHLDAESGRKVLDLIRLI